MQGRRGYAEGTQRIRRGNTKKKKKKKPSLFFVLFFFFFFFSLVLLLFFFFLSSPPATLHSSKSHLIINLFVVISHYEQSPRIPHESSRARNCCNYTVLTCFGRARSLTSRPSIIERKKNTFHLRRLARSRSAEVPGILYT